MIKAVLFDFDGTLINTNDLIFDSYRYAFKEVLGREISMDEILKLYGRPLYISLMEYGEIGERLYKIYREYNEARHDLVVKAFDGAVEGVKRIIEKGYLVGVVTSKRLELVNRGLKIMGLENTFDFIVTPADTSKVKPEPEPILCGCEKLGVLPEETIYVGDSEFDLLAGRAAGTKLCAVKYSVTPHDVLLAYCPEYFVESIADFADMLEEIN